MSKQLGPEEVLWVKKDQGISCRGRIPLESEFFKDHFPGFPILPGVLALEMLKQSADLYIRHVYDSDRYLCSVKKITAVKFSHYLKPGEEWESLLRLDFQEGETYKWVGQLLHQGQVAVSAKLILQVIKVQPAILI